MTHHTLTLATEPFNAIAAGRKTIESRLYDEKRQTIQIGDTLTLTNRDNPSEAVTATVIGLLRYATFHDLFTHNDISKFDGPSVEWLQNQVNEFYSPDEQAVSGVIGIEFILQKELQ